MNRLASLGKKFYAPGAQTLVCAHLPPILAAWTLLPSDARRLSLDSRTSPRGTRLPDAHGSARHARREREREREGASPPPTADPAPSPDFDARSARRLTLAPLAASDSFESSVAVDFAEPELASEDREVAFASDEEGADEASAGILELEKEVTAAEGDAGKEVAEYVEPPEEAKVYVGNLPYNIDSERLAQLFEQAGVVKVAEVIYSRETDWSRGFGFVTMSTVEEAEKAVETFHRYGKETSDPDNGRQCPFFEELHAVDDRHFKHP